MSLYSNLKGNAAANMAVTHMVEVHCSLENPRTQGLDECTTGDVPAQQFTKPSIEDRNSQTLYQHHGCRQVSSSACFSESCWFTRRDKSTAANMGQCTATSPEWSNLNYVAVRGAQLQALHVWEAVEGVTHDKGIGLLPHAYGARSQTEARQSR